MTGPRADAATTTSPQTSQGATMITTGNLTDVVQLTGNTAADHPATDHPPAGPQIAEGADTGHGGTEHADPVTETSDSAGTEAGERRPGA